MNDRPPILPDDEAARLAADELERARERAARSRGFLTISGSDRIVERGPQRFAVFGPVAHELAEWSTTDAEGRILAARPAIVDGRAWLEAPDEGRPGLMHYLYVAKHEAWTVSFLHTGWLWARELELSNAEIAGRIEDDVARGDNVRVPKPPGWA